MRALKEQAKSQRQARETDTRSQENKGLKNKPEVVALKSDFVSGKNAVRQTLKTTKQGAEAQTAEI